MRNRGILTDDERELLLDERPEELEDEHLQDVRYDVTERIQNLRDDVEMLVEHGEEELVSDLYNELSRAEGIEADKLWPEKDIGLDEEKR